MIVVELIGAIDNVPTLQTFYLSDENYATKSTDTPASTAFDPTLKQRGSFGVSIFADGYIAGATKLDIGEIVVSNASGAYDGWLNYGFGGRKITIRSGTKGAAYPAAFTTVLTGTVSSIFVNKQELRIRVKDLQSLFENPAIIATYGGTNSLPNGVDGSTDIVGRTVPQTYGSVKNVSPVCVNTSKLTYQVGMLALADISAVYDRGASLTKGADFATTALLQAAAPAAGTYVTCFAQGLFRLGSAPAGQITCDALQGAAAANRTVAQILKSLALAAGVASSDIDAASVTALDAANSSVVGTFIDDDRSFAEVMDELAASVGAYYGFDPSGKFIMGRLEAPSGSSLLTIGEYYAGTSYERRPLKDIDIPVYRVAVKHSKMFTVQSDLAAAVSAVVKATVAQQYRVEVAQDGAIKTQFNDAQAFSVETLLTVKADAATEAARLLALHKVRRDAFEIPLPLAQVTAAGIKIGSCVTLQINRFGLSAGKLMRVIGIKTELSNNSVTLTVWG